MNIKKYIEIEDKKYFILYKKFNSLKNLFKLYEYKKDIKIYQNDFSNNVYAVDVYKKYIIIYVKKEQYENNHLYNNDLSDEDIRDILNNTIINNKKDDELYF